MALSFIFGGNTGETPESLARRREVQDALAAQIMGHAPTTTLGGIGALLSGAAIGLGRYRDNKAETEAQKSATNLFSSLISGAKPSDAATSSMIPSNAKMPPVAGTMENARSMDRNSVQNYAGMDLKSGIKSTADALGIDPADLATAISYETAGTFDPKKTGPTTQWGQHRGLIQFGEPQAKQYGVDWNDPINSQLGPDGAVAKYLRDAGVQPGMGLKDIYSAINAGRVGRYNASDANNGGAPGTVADKVAGMADHRRKALALLGGDQPNDAQSTMAAMMADPRGQQTQPVQVADNSGQLPAQQTTQQNSALAGVDPKLIQAMTNPWLSADQKAVIQTMIKQQMEQADPMHGLELRKATAEVNALEHPGPDYDFVNGKDGSVFRVDKRSGKMETVYGPQEQVPDAVKALRLRAAAAGLKEGSPEFQQFMLNGGTVDKAPNDVQEYEYARKQGFTGTFQDWQLQNKRASATNVNIDQKAESQFDKTVAEKQAASFNAMADEGMNARSDLAVIDQLDTLMKGQGGAITGLSAALSKWGVPFEGTDDLQAANALINKLVPSQRTPGSGTMSDGDVALFRASLPNLWNQPGGNQKIIDTMRGLAKYKQDQGEIADQVMSGEITRQEGRRMLRQLPNPLADFKAPDRSAAKKDATSDTKEQPYDPNLPFWAKPKKQVTINGYKIEEVQ
jgi:hypothetical protein